LADSAKSTLPIIEELGDLPFEERAAHLQFHLVVPRDEKTTPLITTHQRVTQRGAVFAYEMISAAMLDRLLNHRHDLPPASGLRRRRLAIRRQHAA